MKPERAGPERAGSERAGSEGTGSGGAGRDPGGVDGRIRAGVGAAILGLSVNAVLVVTKITAGLVGNSYALVADGVESTLDLFSSLVVWRGLRVAGREPDARHPFGYGKAEPLAAAIVAVMLLLAAVGIAVQAVREIVVPHSGPAPWTLAVLVVVVLVKETLFRRVADVGAATGSSAVSADAWHHRSDAVTSGMAFLGIAVALVGGPGWERADDVAALLASGIILWNGGRLLRPAVSDLMDRAPGGELLARIVRVAEGVDGVRRIEKVMARSVGTGYRAVLHVHADPAMSLRDAHALGGEVRSTVCRDVPGVLDVVIHMEPDESRAEPDSPASGPGDGLTSSDS